MADPFHARRVDCGKLAELAVLTAVLAIAALASYIHLRAVWLHAGAPVPDLGPLLVDGLFAAAWLRMRRRRLGGDRVGGLAWLALGLALVSTLAGNVAAAWIAGHRDSLSLIVAGIPAATLALVWELVTGHGQRAVPAARQVETAGEPQAEPDAEPQPSRLEQLLRDGAGRGRLVEELGISPWEARKHLSQWRKRQTQEATG